MSKRAPLDLNQFKIELPRAARDPLDSIIPAAPPLTETQIPQKVEIFPSPIVSNHQEVEAKNERPNERTLERTKHRTVDRVIVRHTFDIFADQLYALQAIQLKAVQRGKRKPKLGKMVQQGIDLYLENKAKQDKKLG